MSGVLALFPSRGKENSQLPKKRLFVFLLLKKGSCPPKASKRTRELGVGILSSVKFIAVCTLLQHVGARGIFL